MNTLSYRNLSGIVALLLTLLLSAAPAWSESTRAGDASNRFSGKKAAYLGAYEKTGFYTGIINDSVTILDEQSYRTLAYKRAPKMLVTYQEQEIELQSLLPHSIVKLIIVDTKVVEIVLIQESS